MCTDEIHTMIRMQFKTDAKTKTESVEYIQQRKSP